MSQALKLPTEIAAAVGPLFKALPMERAMARLVVTDGPAEERVAEVERIIKDKSVAARPPLIAALWLYIDDLDRSHKVSQQIESTTGSYWHGIMHRREGDFSNSHYWFRKVGAHPAMPSIGQDYDAHAFIDEVERVHQAGKTADALVERQRREWMRLFEWCCANG